MAKMVMSNLMEIMAKINVGDLDTDDVFVIDPRRVIGETKTASTSRPFIPAYMLSKMKVEDLWPDGDDSIYLIRLPDEDDETEDDQDDTEDPDFEFII